MADKKQQIADLRAKLAELDRDLLRLLESRASLSRQVHENLEEGTASVDISEREWLEELDNAASGDLPKASLHTIFRQIRAEARTLEEPVRVAFLGPEGGFSHEMAKGYFGVLGSYTEAPTVAEALEEVTRERAVYAVFPFESSLDGLVLGATTALAQTELVLVAERSLPATYDLVSRTGNLGDIEKVYATAAAHASCELFLERELGRTPVIDVRSPVAAAHMVQDDHGSAAIVPAPCGREQGLEVVLANVGDTSDLRYRFGVAGARPASRSGHDTTSLLFSVSDSPGSLFEVLRHFAERGINLKKLQSRPVRGQNWEYLFYVEVSGHVTDRPVVTALEAIKRNTQYLKVLGSFPAQV